MSPTPSFATMASMAGSVTGTNSITALKRVSADTRPTQIHPTIEEALDIKVEEKGKMAAV